MPIGSQRFTPPRDPIATFRCPAAGAAVCPVVKTKWQSQLMAYGQLQRLMAPQVSCCYAQFTTGESFNASITSDARPAGLDDVPAGNARGDGTGVPA